MFLLFFVDLKSTLLDYWLHCKNEVCMQHLQCARYFFESLGNIKSSKYTYQAANTCVFLCAPSIIYACTHMCDYICVHTCIYVCIYTCFALINIMLENGSETIFILELIIN